MNHDANEPEVARGAANGGMHLRRIDVLRAVAILSVFGLHWYGQSYGTDHLQWNGLVRDPATAPSASFFLFYPLSFGWIGVPLFFVISGFCIHASALKNNELHVGRFFWRRFWRIYPPYLAALALSALLSGVDFSSPEGRAQIWSHLLLVHNFDSAWIFALNGVFWSLAVEAQLYLLYPLLWKMRARWGISVALQVTLWLSVGVRLVCAVFFTNWNEELSGPIWTSPAILWFDWTLGAFLAERYLRGDRAFPVSAMLRWLMLVVVAVSTLTKPTAIFTFSLASVLCALLMESYLWRTRREARWERVLVPLGLCSYSFYLLHYLMIPPIADQLRRASFVQDPAALMLLGPLAAALIFAVSYVAYGTVERGSIGLGRRLITSVAPREQRSARIDGR